MTTTPKNIHDGLRRLQTNISAIRTDLNNYLENPAEYQSEYFQDTLEVARNSMDLIKYVREQLKGATHDQQTK